MRRFLDKKTFFAVALLLVLALGTLLGAGSAAAAGTGQSGKPGLPQKKLTLVQFASAKLKLQNVSGKAKWSSSDPQIATVSASGKVKAKAAGKCSVTATVSGKTYTCKVMVKALSLSWTRMTLVRGRQGNLQLNNEAIKPAWRSSDTQVATVSDKGVVQALTPGDCLITAAYKGVEVSCELKVLSISTGNLTSLYTASKKNRGKIILAGSSSMDYWNSAPQAFAPYEVINMAIGGTTVVQWLDWYERMIVRYQPAAVVIYVGSNDLGAGNRITGEENAANTIRLLKGLKSRLKKTPIFYLGVNPCWSRQGAWEQIRTSNALVKAYCERFQYLYYINIGKYFADASGLPRRELFLADQLHPSEAGYAIWKDVAAAKVIKTLVKLEKQQSKKSTSKKG